MPTADGKLKPGEKPMTEEKWQTHKDCNLAKRDHKYHWKSADSNQAICAHCGHETTLTRKDGDRD